MQVTPTEQRILNILKSDATVSAKAISLQMGWGDNLGNVHNYLKRLREKGVIRVVPQRIEVADLQHYCKES